MASNIVWGLDIGSSAIKAVKMQRSGTECSIVDFDIIDIPGGDDPAERPARLSVAMKSLIETHKFGNDPVFLAIPGAVCLHREFTLPPSPETRVHEMVQFEAKQQIPFPLDQVEWGYERFEGGDDNKAINVTLIAVRKSDIQELLTLSENFNLKLAGIVAAPVALYNFIHHEFQPKQTTLILDAGARGTDFVVMNKRQIYFRSIQIAGREITRVLENKFKVPYDKAESLKKNIEKSPQMDQILTVIEPTLRNLGADVQRTIGFYKAKSKGQKIQQCYLLGHAFRLPKMAEYLQAQVREAPFALVEGLQRIRMASVVSGDSQKFIPRAWDEEFPTMPVAIGLAIQGLGLSELKLNLIPQETKEVFTRQQWKVWAAAAVFVLLVTLGVTYYFASTAAAEYARLRDDLNKTVEKIDKDKAAESAAIKAIPEKSELAQRFLKIAHDRAKEQEIYSKIPTIKGDDGHAFFGTTNHIHLTSLYASRTPLSREHRFAPSRIDKIDRAPSEEFKRMYESLNPGAADPYKLAPELRPEAPLVVILSGEVEVQNNNIGGARNTLVTLGELLKKLPQLKQTSVNGVPTPKIELVYSTETPITYDEHVLPYGTDGALKLPPKEVDPLAPPPTPETINKFSYISFHFMFAWEDPEDKDIAPAAPVETPKK